MHLPIKSTPQDTDHFCTLGYVFYTGISIKKFDITGTKDGGLHKCIPYEDT